MTQLPLLNICMHPGCSSPAKNKIKKGYCSKHYDRFLKYKDSNTVWGRPEEEQLSVINFCQHPGCAIAATTKKVKGYCRKHLGRIERHGHSFFARPINNRHCSLFIVDRKFAKYWMTIIGGKQQYVHRVIMERELGRALETHEQVHHIDENGLNNSLDNLEVVTATEHNYRYNHVKRRKGLREKMKAKGTKNLQPSSDDISPF